MQLLHKSVVLLDAKLSLQGRANVFSFNNSFIVVLNKDLNSLDIKLLIDSQLSK